MTQPIERVAIEFGRNRAGWMNLHIETRDAAGNVQADDISCSYVYDPLPQLSQLMTSLSQGLPGAMEIDEEGRDTIIRIDLEPGAYIGRLRVYEPGANGEVETAHIDAGIDIIQLLHAFSQAWHAMVANFDHKDMFTLKGRMVWKPEIGRVDTVLASLGACPDTRERDACFEADRAEAIARYRAMVPNPVISAQEKIQANARSS